MKESHNEIESLESLVGAQSRVLDLMAGNAPISVILGELADLFSQEMPGAVVSILLAGEDKDRLVGGFPPNPNSKASLAPIMGSDNEVLGTFVVSWDSEHPVSARERWIQDQFARLAQVAIERHRFQTEVGEMLADERRRLAEALHDDPIQAITSIGLRLQRLSRSATPDQQEQFQQIQIAVSSAVDRMRQMLFDLHPPTLDDEGLGSAVELYLFERFDPLEIEWELDDSQLGEVPAATRSLAYRLTREALANIVRHAEATNVNVLLTTESGPLSARITDNGKGFDTALLDSPRAGHLGTSSCRYLARRASGQWTVSSTPGSGTMVEFHLPTATMT